MKILLRSCVAIALLLGGSSPSAAQSPPTDAALKARVQSALVAASDVPGREIIVDVKSGIVILSGRVSSDSMRGVAYPTAYLQQNVGAVVRALSGVKQVQFSIEFAPEGGPAR